MTRSLSLTLLLFSAFSGAALAQSREATVQQKAVLDKAITKYTKAKCIMSYEYDFGKGSTYDKDSHRNLTLNEATEKVYQGLQTDIARQRKTGASVDSGHGKGYLWVLISALGETNFMYIRAESGGLATYTCKAQF